MYQLNLSKGSYRLVFWLMDKHGKSGHIKSGIGGWAVKASKDLNYSQPMMSSLAKELVMSGVFIKTTDGYDFSL